MPDRTSQQSSSNSGTYVASNRTINGSEIVAHPIKTVFHRRSIVF